MGSTADGSRPLASIAARSSSSRGHSSAWIFPPRQRSAAAAMTPSGEPPTPINTSTPEPGIAQAMAAATSPSEIMRIRAPASRTCSFSAAWRGRSSMTTVTSATGLPSAALMATRLAPTLAVMSMACAAAGPTAIFCM